MTTPRYNAISRSSIYVLDQDQALDFYVGTLGFEVAHQYAKIPAMGRNVHEIHFGVTLIYSAGDFD